MHNLMPDFTVGDKLAPAANNILSIPIKKPKLPKTQKKETPKTPNTEITIDRRRMILILQFYVLEFPEKLKAYKGTNFEKYKDEELQNLKNEFDFIIGAKCNVKSTQYAFIINNYIR